MNKDIEEARKLFAQKCDFILAAAEPKQFPDSPLPEVAFIGRSNVGKSSLINALTGHKGLARTSNTPGRTQQIVFFNLADRLMLVDLPGYGHAEAPREEQNKWSGLVHTYLRKREALKCVCLLVDGNYDVKANDLDMMHLLDRAAVLYRIVLTKMDHLRDAERESRLQKTKELITKHPAALSDALATSAEDKSGIAELREILAGLVGG
ncbi:MAG: ribosome biogenesis GTP-binding protein YihA/YsxC [Bdellovibrionales bacterium]